MRVADPFYKTKKWRVLRYNAIKKGFGKCAACGAKNELQVDHIKPRGRYPELEWDANNLQVLCIDCNIGKGAYHEDDWAKI